MKKALELYLHIPFCIRKCEYCDFLSGPADERNRRTYLDALLRELAAVGPQAEDYEVTSVYIGGGTPSLLPGEWMEKLMSWGLVDTFRHANPQTADRFSWFDYRSKGFDDNRGLRIDLLLASQPLAECCVETGIDYEIRSMEKPSDHAPVWATFRR